MSVLVSQAAGCIIESDDGVDPPIEDSATILAQWSLKSIAENAIIPYPPGITTAAVYAQEVDANYNPVGDPFIDLFNVEDGSGRTAALPASVYRVWIELTSEGGSNVQARSLSAYVDVIDTDKTFTTTLVDDGGYFQFDWDLRGASSNNSLTCAEAGLAASSPSGIYIQAFLATSQTADGTDIFSCADGTGVTGAYLHGDYDVVIDARTDDETPVGAATKATSIRMHNEVTDLGVVTIPIDGL